MGGPSKRPKTRTLVRWNDDLDKELLLWIVWCCGESGWKLPFPRIAKCMGPMFSDGAIVQHLAKIRNKMDAAGLHVPPAQKRGTVTKSGSSIYRPKPKSVNDPVPRIRPAIAPPPLGYSLYDGEHDDDDEEEEEVEEHSDDAPKRSAAIKTVRPPTVYRTTINPNLKLDSDEDDPLPALYDSDNESSARKMSASPEKDQSKGGAPRQQMKLKFNQSAQQPFSAKGDTQVTINQGYSTAPQPRQTSPPLKYESIDDRMADTMPSTNIGARRKSSAMTAADDDGDDEYDPGSERKNRKKPRATRSTKRSKVDDKAKGDANKSDVGDRTAVRKETTHTNDRTDMPPPAIPNINNNRNTGWNNSFMQQPFGAPEFQTFRHNGVTVNDAGWNDVSPTTVQPYDASYSTLNMAGTSRMLTNAYTYPSYDYSAAGMTPGLGDPNTRNHSFGSSASNSTIETQPATWRQPRRTLGFANPREASAALHAAVHTSDAETSTHVNVYNSPANDPSLWNGYDDDIFVGTSLETVVPRPGAAVDESRSRFVGMPEMTDKDINFAEFFDEQREEPYNVNCFDPNFSFTDYLNN